MQDLIEDAKTAVKVFTDMRKARAEGKVVRLKMVRRYPCTETSPAFYDTIEGCMLANRDKAVHDAVWRVYKGLPYEDKRVLCFSPEPGRYLLRVQLWRDALGPVLSPGLYHKAVGAILHQYVSIKVHRAARDKTRVRIGEGEKRC